MSPHSSRSCRGSGGFAGSRVASRASRTSSRSLRCEPGGRDSRGDRLADRVAQLVGVVDDQRVGQAGSAALLAAVDGPDQGAVGGVELLDAGLLLDDGGTVEPDPCLRG